MVAVRAARGSRQLDTGCRCRGWYLQHVTCTMLRLLPSAFAAQEATPALVCSALQPRGGVCVACVATHHWAPPFPPYPRGGETCDSCFPSLRC